MPDAKITALTSIGTSTDPANDPLVLVDVSDTSMAASGTTKKVTLNQLLATSPTATLASATITGDLTVDTSTLKVDSANNRVGIGTASPGYDLEVAGSVRSNIAIRGNFAGGTDIAHLRFVNANGSIVGDIFSQNTNGGASDTAYLSFQTASSGTLAERYRIAGDGVATWSNVGGVAGTAMTLNATGLGVGGSPDHKLQAVGGYVASGKLASASSGNIGGLLMYCSTDNGGRRSWGLKAESGLTGVLGFWVSSANNTEPFSGSQVMSIDGSGNVGVGVTPSAWNSNYKAIDFGSGSLMGRASGTANNDFYLFSNAYYAASAYKFKVAAAASAYFLAAGEHRWQITSSTPSVDGNITWTQAMTLDASGNLLVGTTSAAGVRLDVQTTTGNCIGRVKSNAAASTASFIIDYVETLGCTYIKKAGSDVWIYGVQNDTSATPNFKINTASNVGVQLVSGATAWTTLSDETVKDIIEPIGNAVAKVGSLRSVIGKFKTDSEGTRRSFLIAQDVKSVLPEAVDVVGENNELGLRYTEVIPLLVAAIKELTARVEALEA